MKRFIFAVFVLIFGFGFSQPTQDLPSQDQYEHILAFHSDIVLSKDAEVIVTENIRVYAANIKIHRGIFRSLPRWRNINGRKIRINYDILSVKRNHETEEFHTEKTDSDLAIFVGKKDYILPAGVYDYELRYKTRNQIGFFDRYDEFYWNVNGNLWDFTIDRISAKISLPENAVILQNSCYTGSYGNSETNCSSNRLSTHSIEFSAQNLRENEGLTVAVGFEKGIFAAPPPPGFPEKYGILLLMIISGLVLFFYFFSTWRKFGIDPEKPVVYPQFSAPQNLSPASVGYLEKESYSDHMITAAIVDLAVKGYLQIEEEDKRILGIFGNRTYTLKQLKEPDQALPEEEINLMNTLFSADDTSIAFTGKYNSKIENAVQNFKASLAFQHDNFLKKGDNTGKLVLPVLLSIGIYALGLFLGYRMDGESSYLTVGLIMAGFAVAAGFFFALFFNRSSWGKIFFGLISVTVIAILCFIVIYDKEMLQRLNYYAAYGFLLFAFIVTVIFQYLIQQPTPAKLETKSLIEGFRMYLGTAEEQTLQFHNPPTMTPEVFEKMLPYAMVFGVEKIWGEKFRNMLKNSALGKEEYHSNWFVGTSMMNMNFANTLNASLSQSIASSATQPSSSGSGSGGGGFSGGGGGGGGGGGW